MLFNSLQFAIFFIFVYGLYILSNHKRQNLLLLVASYIFYAAWDWRFLSLIFISTILDYACGIKIHNADSESIKRKFLLLSIIGNLSILVFFKYFNFFAHNLELLLSSFGFIVHPHFLRIILPVGISFYTFQTMSYTIDIYRGNMKPTRRFFDFALFVAFFPQLVAGPIERAKHLLPQILGSRKLSLDKFYEGCYLIFWGLFLKVFIADNLSNIVDPIFSTYKSYSGVDIVISLYAFAFQIFCDFAGYSNMARGLGKCMGFDIMINFNLPYISTNPVEFWRRWHISLSSWLRDYLYIPLGGNHGGPLFTYRNIAITMLLGGLWHGAAWTFIIWGGYHALLLIGYKYISPLFTTSLNIENIFLKKAWKILRVLLFFQFISIGWLFFRAQSIGQVAGMLRRVVSNFNFSPYTGAIVVRFISFITILVIIQLIQYVKKDLMAPFKAPTLYKVLFYVISFYLLIFGGLNSGKEFIYFQF